MRDGGDDEGSEPYDAADPPDDDALYTTEELADDGIYAMNDPYFASDEI